MHFRAISLSDDDMGVNKPFKICREGMIENVIYNKKRFQILNRLRKRAISLMRPLIINGFKPYIYGSIARGDVREESDIDIVLLYRTNPVLIEEIYNKAGLVPYKKIIIQATPTYVPKLYLWFDESGREIVSLPLSNPRKREIDFYKFGGLIDHKGLSIGRRVTGVDKRLMLIVPTDEGHRGECIINKEGYIAKMLNTSESLVKERVSVLSKRNRHGRTGVFLEYPFKGDTMDVVKYLSKTNKFFRKMIDL